MIAFFRSVIGKSSSASAMIVVKAWPNELNPCPHRGKHLTYPDRGLRTSYWWCNGKATEICSNCVWEREDEFERAGVERPRIAALKTFNPDPDGADCVLDV